MAQLMVAIRGSGWASAQLTSSGLQGAHRALDPRKDRIILVFHRSRGPMPSNACRHKVAARPVATLA